MSRKAIWCCGVTTVPSRFDTLLPRTLKSLEQGGFPKPRLFIDGCRHPFHDYDYERFGLEVTNRWPSIGAAGNWIVGAWELFFRNPQCSHFAMFQDDVIFVRNLRQYLDRNPWPKIGYANLYTTKESRGYAPKGFTQGWFPTKQNGRGALGLVFTQDAIRKLLASDQLASKPLMGRQASCTIDGAVVQALGRNINWLEHCHLPSLCQHTGNTESQMGHNNQPLADPFPGEEFDALSFLSEQPPEVSPLAIQIQRIAAERC